MNKKASLKIHEIAEDYLSNDPTAWLKFSKALTSKNISMGSSND